MSNFILNSYHHFKNTGAVCPSSSELVSTIIDYAQLSDKKHIVELGPGTGVITEAIIRNKLPQATYFGLDINATFIESINEKIDGALIYHDSAESIQKYLSLHGIEKADCIISSLPWANFNDPFQKKLLSTLHDALNPGGVFITYAYTIGLYLAKGRLFRKNIRCMFSEVEKSKTVWSNIPPAFIYKATK